MFSTCSELTPRAPIPDGRMEPIMQPCLALTEVELDLLRTEEGPVSEKSKLLIDDELLVDMTIAELNKMCGDRGWAREFASGDCRVGDSFKWELKRRREWLQREREERERRQKYLLRFGLTKSI